MDIRKRYVLPFLAGVLFLVPPAGAFPGLAEEGQGKQQEKKAAPETPKLVYRPPVTGIWDLTLEEKDAPHIRIQLRLDQDGESLTGSLTMEDYTTGLREGTYVNGKVSFAFDHPGGETIKLEGAWKIRAGLEGTWEQGDLKGKWKAKRISR